MRNWLWCSILLGLQLEASIQMGACASSAKEKLSRVEIVDAESDICTFCHKKTSYIPCDTCAQSALQRIATLLPNHLPIIFIVPKEQGKKVPKAVIEDVGRIMSDRVNVTAAQVAKRNGKPVRILARYDILEALKQREALEHERSAK